MSHACRRLCIRLPTSACHAVPRRLNLPYRHVSAVVRAFSVSRAFREDDADTKAKKLSQKAVDEQEEEVTARRKQQERPWHRAGSDAEPPDESTDPTKGDRTKGRLLTTPTRLLKVILPLPYHATEAGKRQAEGENADSTQDEIEPLALLVHPQQPLSYLERLIQAELPPIQDKNLVRVPNIFFRAEADHSDNHKNEHATKPKEGNVASYSGLGHEGPKHSDANWVRWSSSTDVGDFIRDAARGREFAIDIEGYDKELRVAVPSFNDRTYYMRMRLRRLSRRIDRLASIKEDCDKLAHRGAHRIAMSGFGVLISWWGVVYYVTFHTDAGWDLVEPVTYLVGLTTIMGGYLWFLYISRDLSYKAALNVTVSKRQTALYHARGFDIQKWENTVQEANALRREIKMVAAEYDVDWDEMGDLGGEDVKKVLNKERKARKKDDDEDDEEDEKERHQHKSDDKDDKAAKEGKEAKKKGVD